MSYKEQEAEVKGIGESAEDFLIINGDATDSTKNIPISKSKRASRIIRDPKRGGLNGFAAGYGYVGSTDKNVKSNDNIIQLESVPSVDYKTERLLHYQKPILADVCNCEPTDIQGPSAENLDTEYRRQSQKGNKSGLPGKYHKYEPNLYFKNKDVNVIKPDNKIKTEMFEEILIYDGRRAKYGHQQVYNLEENGITKDIRPGQEVIKMNPGNMRIKIRGDIRLHETIVNDKVVDTSLIKETGTDNTIYGSVRKPINSGRYSGHRV